MGPRLLYVPPSRILCICFFCSFLFCSPVYSFIGSITSSLGICFLSLSNISPPLSLTHTLSLLLSLCLLYKYIFSLHLYIPPLCLSLSSPLSLLLPFFTLSLSSPSHAAISPPPLPSPSHPPPLRPATPAPAVHTRPSPPAPSFRLPSLRQGLPLHE